MYRGSVSVRVRLIDSFRTHTSFIAIGEKAGTLRRGWAGDILKTVKHKASSWATKNVAARFSHDFLTRDSDHDGPGLRVCLSLNRADILRAAAPPSRLRSWHVSTRIRLLSAQAERLGKLRETLPLSSFPQPGPRRARPRGRRSLNSRMRAMHRGAYPGHSESLTAGLRARSDD